MNMHTAAVDTEDRFGHKGGINTMLGGNLFNHQTIGHNLVGHGQGIGISHIDFMLADSHLMMRLINTDSHLFQGQNGLISQLGGGIQEGHIIITTFIQPFRAFIILKIEILQLRTDIVGKTHVGGFL